MREALAALGLLLALALSAAFRGPLPVPPRLPAAACQPWMADCIPGVGAKRREQVAAEIRAGRIPAAARAWFAP
ncbi:MAG: hypothetical protein RMM29_02075 [Planctomycetota bacterium]|nr:hypothetical protein [Planctomycetota bacterium]MCX8040281.1 hypothetical protein [Planctomycetota bacterium]MDW8372424.1 hypothetical protein [Planctomycetota bacterium]